ncbi:pectinesterase inhibitor 1-like [Abrus precatorius]|uniref:Pectinesterase inhibitor 1-like n=1 Tax=Abrus precatorius TaxID=3816 RepID=A0A8B8LP51_ABRPR|nr:pectinesterase inhibitor 1-like [Abrus precatorius]
MSYNFSSLVIVFLLFVVSSYAIPAQQVNDICRQSKNPSFCVTFLNSKPNANLYTLTQYTIEVVSVNVTNTIKLINKLISQSANDSEAKRHYQSCLVHFGYNEGALGDVDTAQELLKKKDYRGVNVAASSILTDVEDCISGESPSDPPFPDPSILPKYAYVVDLFAEIILILYECDFGALGWVEAFNGEEGSTRSG